MRDRPKKCFLVSIVRNGSHSNATASGLWVIISHRPGLCLHHSYHSRSMFNRGLLRFRRTTDEIDDNQSVTRFHELPGESRSELHRFAWGRNDQDENGQYQRCCDEELHAPNNAKQPLSHANVRTFRSIKGVSVLENPDSVHGDANVHREYEEQVDDYAERTCY